MRKRAANLANNEFPVPSGPDISGECGRAQCAIQASRAIATAAAASLRSTSLTASTARRAGR